MAHQKPRVDPEIALEPAEVVGEGGPVPWDPGLQGDEGHALHLGHHPPDVVVVPALIGARVKPQLPPMTRGHAVQVGRRGGGVPEQLGVVVGVGIDDPGSDHQALGVELGGRRPRRPRRRPRSSRRGCRRRPSGRGPGAVDHQAVADDVVEHVAFLPHFVRRAVAHPTVTATLTDRQFTAAGRRGPDPSADRERC